MAEEDGELRLVAAGFEDQELATAAEAELRRILDVDEPDIALHSVGGTPDFVNGYQLVLGARIRQARMVDVEGVFRRFGGEVLTEVPADWAGQ